MKKALLTHAAFGCATAFMAAAVTYLVVAGPPPIGSHAHAQTSPATGTRQVELFKTTMSDVLGRVVTIRRFEREPGASSGPHRHPGSHTFGYVLEGTYEIRVDDGPLQKLGPGQTFYEPPGALHAISRNGSPTQPVKYLVIQVSDPTKPQTVPEPQ